MKSTTAVLACGGLSSRMGENKLLINLCGKSCIRRSAEAVLSSKDVIRLIVAAPKDLFDIYKKELSGLRLEPIFVTAGKTRAESVKNAALKASGELIMIHDGARPLVSSHEVQSSIDDAAAFGSSIICTPLKDTIRWQNKEKSFAPRRDELYSVRTPQTFSLKLYLKALSYASKDYTDDSQLFDNIGLSPHLTLGEYSNIKLTTRDDIVAAEAILGGKTMRIGHGYDVHRLANGRKLIIGGVDIPYEKGLLGHSDADVLVHALMDALLGAAAMRDIGVIFPDSDPKYSGADSIVLLKEVCRLLRANGFEPVNADMTLIAQAPKLAPYIDKMRENISAAMQTDISAVSVKATTEEGLGFSGAGEGIAAHAVCMIEKCR